MVALEVLSVPGLCGFPELHTLLARFATRLRASPAHSPLAQGEALRV
jgi:hypothetical protein